MLAASRKWCRGGSGELSNGLSVLLRLPSSYCSELVFQARKRKTELIGALRIRQRLVVVLTLEIKQTQVIEDVSVVGVRFFGGFEIFDRFGRFSNSSEVNTVNGSSSRIGRFEQYCMLQIALHRQVRPLRTLCPLLRGEPLQRIERPWMVGKDVKNKQKVSGGVEHRLTPY